MKIERPLWTRGILVSPQQFQQQASLEAWTNECIAQMGVLHPWGVLHASFEQDALAQGRLKAERLHLRFQDGTLVDTDSADLLPATLTLATNLPAQANEATVLLAVPQTYANGGNCLQPDELAERPVRYRQAWRDVQNQFGDDKKQIAVMTHELSLRLSSQENGNYQTCPVALLRRDQQGRWTQDKSFIPPLLSLQASHWCSEQLEILMVQLRARLQRLMGMRRESNARMADFAVADVSLFWLLNALNSAEPVLGNFQRYPASSP
ncbi:type VI secretion system ImpJ/VasE family protein [Ewingella americana]